MKRRALLAAGIAVAVALGATGPAGLAVAAPASAEAPAAADSASISGHARDTTGHGNIDLHVYAVRLDASGTPLTNETDSISTRVAADGSYTLTALPPATYQVEFTTEDSEQQTPDGVPVLYTWYGLTLTNQQRPASITVAAGQRRSDRDVTLYRWGTLSGTVSCPCSLASDASFFVETQDPSTGTWVSQGSGVYRIGATWNLSVRFPGVYRVQYSYDGSYRQNVSPPITMAEGQTANYDFAVLPAVPDVITADRATEFYIFALYNDYLARAASSTEIGFWAGRFSLGSPRSAVAEGFVTSDEYRYIRIDAAYRSILHREPDAKGRLDQLNGMRAGILTTDGIETSLYGSAEYYQTHGSTATTFVDALYTSLLHRTGSADDYAFWADLVRQHGRGWVIAEFWDSTETISERVSAMYNSYLGRTPDPAGLRTWVGLALQLGDSGLRAGLTSSDEYFALSATRFE